MQAITTKYFGPGNVRGSRIKAIAAAGSLYVEYDDALNLARNHRNAARALAISKGWRGRYWQGVLASGDHVFVAEDDDAFAVTV